jgi:nucleoside-diphosphate-sugar epimerase
MRVLVTGGAGFIGGAVVRHLVRRGDRVVAIVRDPDRAGALTDLGVEVRAGDLSSTGDIIEAMRTQDAAVHIAGAYRIGIAARERSAMLDANVGAALRLLDAAATTRIERIVHISTANVFGNTRGRIVDEHYRRDLADGFLSYYDETKYLAHRAVEERIAAKAPIVIVMPGATYGPRDHSEIGLQLRGAHDGTLRYLVATDTGISAAHVDDVAAGIVAALDRGRIGESYVLGGQNVRLKDAMAAAARVGGRGLPRLEVPSSFVRLAAYAPATLARLAGMPEDLGEVVRSSLGVTYWASSAKAAAEIGYAPRDLASGLRAAFSGN